MSTSADQRVVPGAVLCALARSQHVERTLWWIPQLLDDVRVDHGRAHVGVAEQLLDGADVRPALEKVGGE